MRPVPARAVFDGTETGELVVLAGITGIADRPGETGHLAHHCTQIPGSVRAGYAPDIRAIMEGTAPMSEVSSYLEWFEQRRQLEVILARHQNAAGAIPAGAVPALTAELDTLLDTVRSSGKSDGMEEAVQEGE
jgi:hypothetical protein